MNDLSAPTTSGAVGTTLSAPRPAEAGRPPWGSSKVAKPHLLEAGEASGNQNSRALLDFSLGRADEATTMHALGTDSAEDMFLLMAQAHLPMPRLPEAASRAMVDSLHALVS